MRFNLLLKGVPGKRAGANADPELKGIRENSKEVRPGDLFAALPGSKVDGRSFAKEALARGASALLLQGSPLKGADVPQFCVKDGAEALAILAHRFHGDPTKRMKVLGVTGTKGKTTTTYLLRSLLEGSGRPAALIGTIAYDTGLRTYEAVNTTPSSLTLAKLLAEARKCRREWAAMEVSSHALEMGRVTGISFKGAIFTNLGRDHLDYHRTRAAYFKAKCRLFTEFPSLKARLVNADDEHGKKLLGELKRKGTGYGIRTSCAYRAKDVSLEPGRVRFSVQGKKFEAPMSGLFNVYNALAAVSLLREMGLPWGALREGLRSAPAVPGRFEEVAEGQDFTVLVDYAHTADALEQALNAARGILKEKGRLICVFGCGGDRDRGKRPLMGGVSARLADKTILTSDNPRTEDPRAILEGILEGIPDHLRLNGTRRVFVEEERAAAIRMALSMAVPGDLVLIAGKGHETYQVLGARKVHFDDREVAREALRELRKF